MRVELRVSGVAARDAVRLNKVQAWNKRLLYGDTDSVRVAGRRRRGAGRRRAACGLRRRHGHPGSRHCPLTSGSRAKGANKNQTRTENRYRPGAPGRGRGPAHQIRAQSVRCAGSAIAREPRNPATPTKSGSYATRTPTTTTSSRDYNTPPPNLNYFVEQLTTRSRPHQGRRLP